ncbi:MULTISPECIES: threonine-phosphate decarboxylase CobD [Paraburkholderia]|uniref:threonine-phosphate decarboxylase CobD n=1 Tax=Paraburkholderia TaxID=1822464 RepID=UPI00224FAA21|nr:MULTISPECIES: threonine-phosphate decarboxylase CobD [Paraburkholderia]MCX4159862.1 threonine-phosphate decarboxylase CobD [Paraburkholderia megapolitana]MDN7155362.1 threonine-phosphate decarboxylase CobD [Paraburkholderia sp. CHISQ3]MDQ6492406.1 threonine-phosphate decarboxylase CobD [Paraburkholderia megapolitana]
MHSEISVATSSPATVPGAVIHGGNLHEAARLYGIPYASWLDLSTGINPHGYPVPPVPPDTWRRLPDEGDDFAECAARYYGAPDAEHVLPVAGSQAAIRALPALLSALPALPASSPASRPESSTRATVGIAPLTYSEYAPAFARAGYAVSALDVACENLPDVLTHAVVVNPNNPTAAYLDAKKLLRWHAQLSARGGTLIVDEAFADAMPDIAPRASLADRVALPGLVVLRSPGKFFGLAGVRAGFVLAVPAQLRALRDVLGAWTVSGPARHAVSAAFADRAWQQQMRNRLAADSTRLVDLLHAHRLVSQATPLFAWTDDVRAAALHRALAERGIWTRLFTQPASLRFGLPATPADWQRFEQALQESIEAIDALHNR